MSTTFQDIIQRLHVYWAEQGCLLWQPYSEKVGAGTMNPATVLRVLGPGAWKVAYVEPSYRPDDGRYGENPNRMQMHHQYQVILKPDPGDPLEMYLRSLEAIGISIKRHDIRFVEDNWESPALGAWGLGWEVWLDGMEITQFTYFQQAAGCVLPIPAVEITYGLDRIAMYLQGVRRVWDLRWNDDMTFGQVLLQAEVDHCKYDFEIANVERLNQLYRLYEDEAKDCIAAGLVMPAFDQVLRCSHTFNVLDSRGAIGVTERAGYFGRMRRLTQSVAELYLKQRGEEDAVKAPPPAKPESLFDPATALPTEAADFVFEIGIEELPARDAISVVAQWKESVPALLKRLRLEHKGVTVTGTPRRLSAYVRNLAPRQPDLATEMKGPSAEQAFDAQGKPTQAALGFAKKLGVPTEALRLVTEGKKRQLAGTKTEARAPAAQVLAAGLPELITGLRFAKTMRWNETGVAFSRPLRWMLALHGDTVVPFRYAGVVSGRGSFGTRPAGSPPLTLACADDYANVLATANIVERDERRKQVLTQVNALASEVGGASPEDADLLDEVTDLVEWPVGVRGSFEESYLQLPQDVLITVMKSHQRYFPLVDANGKLMAHFVAIANGRRDDMAIVRQGYEDVLRARYADAAFFLKQDLEQPLPSYVPKLKTLTFQEKLGSMLEKQCRIEELVVLTGAALALSAEDKVTTARVASLCKADLATNMVVEMTSLQGVMGREYARRSGEPEAVARALFEHYLPRFAGDALPSSGPALAVGIADRLDSLIGLFAAGLKPTGSADPYGLRRIAGGLVQILIEKRVRFDLRAGLKRAAELQPIKGEGAVEDAVAFVAERLRVLLRERGLAADAVEAALAERSADPCGAQLSATALSRITQEADWSAVLPAYSRCKRLVKDLKEQLPLAPERYTEPATKDLLAAWEEARATLGATPEADDVAAALRRLQEPINRFFTDIMVMVEEPELRRARQALVQRIAALPDGVADLAKLHGY